MKLVRQLPGEYRADFSPVFGGAYWINAIVTLRTRFPVWGSLSWLNKVNTAVLHPGSVIVLVLGAIGVWGKFSASVYISALFVMLCMSAYLFLQIIIDLLEDNQRT
jgi:hypothetical protein